MKRHLTLIAVMLIVVTAPIFAISFDIGASAGASASFYMPYDISEIGFHAKARFPLGGSAIISLDSLPFALGIGGGYYPAVDINLDSHDNDMPFYVELMGYYTEQDEDNENMKTYIGGGLVLYLDELPVLDAVTEYRMHWYVARHFYLSLAFRLDAAFDALSQSDGKAMSFLQLGAGAVAGLGVSF